MSDVVPILIIVSTLFGAIIGFVGALIGNFFASKWEYRNRKKSIIDEKILNRKLDFYEVFYFHLNTLNTTFHNIIENNTKLYSIEKRYHKKTDSHKLDKELNLIQKSIDKTNEELNKGMERLNSEEFIGKFIFCDDQIYKKFKDISELVNEISNLGAKQLNFKEEKDFKKFDKKIKKKLKTWDSEIEEIKEMIREDVGFSSVAFKQE